MVRELLEKIIQESATINDAGEDVSLAIRKGIGRIEEVNVAVYHAGMLAQQIEERMEERDSGKEFKKFQEKKLSGSLKRIKKTRRQLRDVQTELSSLAMYMEQIAVTSDYQNEMSREHRQLVQKFKV